MKSVPRQRSAMIVGLMVLFAVVAVDLGQVAPASAATLTINAVADSYVSGTSTGSNFGTSPTLIANATGPVYTHLMFTVTGSGGATSATLRVYSTSSGTVRTQVYAEPSTWTETGITFANQPARGALLGSLSTLTANSYSTVTVPLTGDGTYAYVLTTGATAARNMTSRETTTPPQLVLSGTTTTSSTTSASPTTTTTTTSSTTSASPTTTTSASPTTTSASPTTTTSASPTTTSASPTTTTTAGGDPVIAAAGDIACAASDPSFNNVNGTATACRSKYTEQIIQQINPVFLLPLGDEQYNSGSVADFAASYAQTWGLSKGISKPVVGNHEYGTSKAAGYFGYFGSAAGNQGAGYYSYEVGAWHVVAINTECTRIDGATGCALGSPQEKWLKSDLASHPNACTLVYGHRPRWASSSFASSDIAPLVNDMVAAHVDLYITGHAHSYERFAPQDAAGNPDGTGITEMVIGTGGAFYTGTGTVAANSVIRKTNLYGVEKLVLHPNSWDYTYVPENSTFTDTGTGTCH
jgi:uncharacterized membrane protein